MRRLWDRLAAFSSSQPASAVQAGRRRKTRETVKRIKPRTPRLELLDRREMFATFTVLSDADAGPNTLRAAIESANATPGSDSIAFNIPGANVKSILLKTPLPTITESVTIDGYTQPGAAKNIQSQGWNGNIRITVAPGLQFSGDSYGLRIQGDNTTVKGLNIWGFQTTTDFADNEDVLIIDTGVGVFIDGADGCVLEGNRIWGNQEQGVFIL
ncbi:MAG TPA: hypothetical protein PLV92_07050, partial [Pirellulaceae bacterium]|nr:hypothetical protein [Pirellulaceae bacterium]